jgi:hypothetical protein
MVREGALAATIVTPSNAGPAVDLVASALRGEPPRPEVTLAPVSYPGEAELRLSGGPTFRAAKP